MYRYRYQRGVSRFVLERFHTHRDKLGTITKIVAKRHRYRTGITYETLMLYGTNGTSRFNGVCWGYGGEGPHTVFDLLRSIGLPKDVAEYFAFNAKRGDYHQTGVDWYINGVEHMHKDCA